MRNEQDTLKKVNEILKLLKPSLALRISITLIFLGPIGKLFLNTLESRITQIYEYLLAIISLLIIVTLWILYIFSIKKYNNFKKEKIVEFSKLLDDERQDGIF